MANLDINQRFLDKFNYLDAIANDIFKSKDFKGPSPIVLLENALPEPHFIHLQTIRKTRNILVHSKRLDGAQPFTVSAKVERYLDQLLSFVKSNRKIIKERYQKSKNKNFQRKNFQTQKVIETQALPKKNNQEISKKSKVFNQANKELIRRHYKKGKLSSVEKSLLKHMQNMVRTEYGDSAFEVLSLMNLEIALKLRDSKNPFVGSVYFHLAVELIADMPQNELEILKKQLEN